MSILFICSYLTFSLSSFGRLSPLVIAYQPSSSSCMFMTLCIIILFSFS